MTTMAQTCHSCADSARSWSNLRARLGEVGRRTLPRNRIRHDDELPSDAGLALEVAGEVDDLPALEPTLGDVLLVHEHDAPLVVHAAIAVVQAVHGGVELV